MGQWPRPILASDSRFLWTFPLFLFASWKKKGRGTEHIGEVRAIEWGLSRQYFHSAVCCDFSIVHLCHSNETNEHGKRGEMVQGNGPPSLAFVVHAHYGPDLLASNTLYNLVVLRIATTEGCPTLYVADTMELRRSSHPCTLGICLFGGQRYDAVSAVIKRQFPPRSRVHGALDSTTRLRV